MKGLVLTYLITAVAAFLAPRYPLIGLQVYVGFAILKPQYVFGWAGEISHVSMIVGVATLIGWAVAGFGSWTFGRGRGAVVSLLLFAFWFVVSATQALRTDGAFLAVTEFSKTLLPFLVGVTMMSAPREWRAMLWTIVLAQGYVSLELHIDYLIKGYNTAAVGFGGMDNNFLGLSLVTTIGPAVALAIVTRHWLLKSLAVLSTVLILHATLLTFSRGAMVGLLAVAAVAFIVMPKRPKHMAALLLVAALAVRLTGPELAERYRTTFASEEERDGSAESRVDLWRDCVKVIQQYPVFGVGPWNWSVVAASYGWPAGKSAHSVWMETAAETGIPGVTFLLLFFGLSALRLWPVARAKPTESNVEELAIANGVVLAIVGFSVSGQFVSAPNLEIAYYIAMVGVALLKTVEVRAIEPSKASVGDTPGWPSSSGVYVPSTAAAPLRRPKSGSRGTDRRDPSFF